MQAFYSTWRLAIMKAKRVNREEQLKLIMECRSSEYSNAIVHAFQKFKAPFSGKIVHIFPEQSAVI